MQGVIVYGVCAGPSRKYEEIALPGLQLASTDPTVEVLRDQTSIFTAYNTILDAARKRDDLEALVLLHDDTRNLDPNLEEKVRAVLVDPDVAVAGVIGGRGHRVMSWWEGERFGRTSDNQHGLLDYTTGVHQVDTVDGLFLVLSPWAVRHLRFDERRYRGFHGYDADICAQARAAGKKVVVFDVEIFHDSKTGDIFGDFKRFATADLTWQLKWQGGSRRERMARRLHRARIQLSRYKPSRR
jgi:Glycosyltransferase like family